MHIVDLEPVFGMRSGMLRGMIWEKTECSIETYVHLLTELKGNVLRDRLNYFNEPMKSMGAPLDK